MVQYAEGIMKKGGSAAENVKVVVRCRPMNEQEISYGNSRYVATCINSCHVCASLRFMNSFYSTMWLFVFSYLNIVL